MRQQHIFHLFNLKNGLGAKRSNLFCWENPSLLLETIPFICIEHCFQILNHQYQDLKSRITQLYFSKSFILQFHYFSSNLNITCCLDLKSKYDLSKFKIHQNATQLSTFWQSDISCLSQNNILIFSVRFPKVVSHHRHKTCVCA